MTDDTERDDINFEPDEELDDVASAQAKLKKLRVELKETQTRASENLAGWQRCKADSINARKDALREAERAVEREKESFVFDLLPALDSFDMAMSTDAFVAMSGDWQQGIRHIQTQLLSVLEQHGIKRFGAAGETFDPLRHEALQEVDDGGGESHTILKVLRHGYALGERIIRPAQVIVRA